MHSVEYIRRLCDSLVNVGAKVAKKTGEISAIRAATRRVKSADAVDVLLRWVCARVCFGGVRELGAA